MIPTVSVIMPIYNREAVLLRAIRSVVTQTYADWELILVDDCSTDKSLEIALQYKSEKIRVIRNEKNIGAGASRNHGIKNSKGRFIALLDSDDLYHTEFLETSIRMLSSLDPEFGFSYTGIGKIDQHGALSFAYDRVWKLAPKYQTMNKPYLYQLHIGTSTGILLRKELLDKIGLFDESMKAAEDTDFFIRVSQYFKGFAIEKVLIYKDDTSTNRLTSDFTKLADAYSIMLVKNKTDIDKDAFLVKRWYTKAMWLDFYAGRRSRAFVNFRQMIGLGHISLKAVIIVACGNILPTEIFKKVHRKMSKVF